MREKTYVFSQSTLPPNVLIEAFNINLFANQIEKAAGSLKLNATALSDKIVALHDWHPNSSAQRLIAITADGKAYRDTGDLTFTSQTAINYTTIRTRRHNKVIFFMASQLRVEEL